MKVLVIGSGGREHTLVWKISQSKKVDKIYCAPGNPGIGENTENVPIQVQQINQLAKFANKEKIDITIVGPEAPLIDGIVDLFKKHDLAIIGPNKKAAQIEGSKAFAKRLMKKYKIPTAKFETFDNFNKAKRHLIIQKYPLVIKADGPCFGKGVSVCKDVMEAILFLKSLIVDKVFGQSGKKIIVEECLYGQEVSFMLASDGEDFVSFLPSQDHKRVFDDDRGPNTGGMGAYAPVPFLSKSMIARIEKEIVDPIIKAMRNEGFPYEGILYPGLIITKKGPKVLEFNCRFGDPEIQPVLSLLKSDIIDLFLAIKNKQIKDLRLKWHKASAVCVVLASKGYPGDYEKGRQIFGLDKLDQLNKFYVFHAGTKIADGKIFTNGGRVIGITASGINLREATQKAYKYIGQNGIHFSGMHYRKDIGRKGLEKKLWNKYSRRY